MNAGPITAARVAPWNGVNVASVTFGRHCDARYTQRDNALGKPSG
jgi:hypothetical protein